MKKPLLSCVLGERQNRPPIWIMRQAGRYLPEYRKLREQGGSFLDLCYNPELASEVSLQPLRRFDLDAAILFSDILVIPDALGQKVSFIQGDGPRLEPVSKAQIFRFEPGRVIENLKPVFETIRLIRNRLARDKTLIGFCGAPWTLATYMIGGKGSTDQASARLFAMREPEAFDKLLSVLVDGSIDYLVAQFEAGVDVVQIFESWALNLDEVSFEKFVIGPNRRIVEGLRKRVPGAPIIGFPRGAAGLLGTYATKTGVNVLGVDYATPVEFVNQNVREGVGIQGNLDPLRLVVGGAQMEHRVEEIVSGFSHRPHIFNLGHGIVPQTPVENVQRLVELVKGI